MGSDLKQSGMFHTVNYWQEAFVLLTSTEMTLHSFK